MGTISSWASWAGAHHMRAGHALHIRNWAGTSWNFVLFISGQHPICKVASIPGGGFTAKRSNERAQKQQDTMNGGARDYDWGRVPEPKVKKSRPPFRPGGHPPRARAPATGQAGLRANKGKLSKWN
jgi:hypothetical protein